MARYRATHDLNDKQRRALEALAGGATVSAAADAAGVHPRTVYKWREAPEFMAALRAADADSLRNLARMLTAASNDALAVLVGVVKNPAAPHAVKVRAAVAILEQRARFYELVNLDERIAVLEARQVANDARPPAPLPAMTGGS